MPTHHQSQGAQQKGRSHTSAIGSHKFEGETHRLKGCAFDMVSSKSADMFAWTVKQVPSYIGHTYQHHNDIHCAIETLKWPTLPTPHVPPVAVLTLWHKQSIKKNKIRNSSSKLAS